ncbi:MAG: hypothetical protein A2091_09620 [Desulfuromonadales bacterium GWD2_61_12]|nr:MAG: hypothetical protein A2005_05430 [Desulfuromonadales bacterium GWC2_61_20]OGR36698.1 MAG: hypothetical protein A2091_09620 [Desulfuromonadales bacterium GWD2_61_12]HAD03773.1 glycerol acyltransferase [Desulfuromonas sp.]HBT81887.1 glycerol acyltransferase [Desulfuromonas sp.]
MPFAQALRLAPSQFPDTSERSPILHQLLENALGVGRLKRLHAQLPAGLEGAAFVEGALELLGIKPSCSDAEVRRIPRRGAVIVAANHPFGGAEGLALLALLLRVRPDVKVIASEMLAGIPELRPLLLPVDNLHTDGGVSRNFTPLRSGIRWLQGGGLLLIFPAGTVSHWQWAEGCVADPSWSRHLATLVRRGGAQVVPAHIPGSNGPLFQWSGMIHERLRTLLLPREMLRRQGRPLEVRFGQAIPQTQLVERPDTEMVAYLRWRTYLLGERRDGKSARARQDATVPGEELISAIPGARLAAELEALPAERCLAAQGPYRVYVASFGEIPSVMVEIGRLREYTFRQVGEGTGMASDLDRFDHSYLHLVLWHMEYQEVVGAYRLGASDHVTSPEDLYTSTLFRYDQTFLERMGPALELGRSFIRPEYQKQFAPLFLLWKGIGGYVARNPRYRTLFGPVSISAEYGDRIRRILTAGLRADSQRSELNNLVAARSPFPSEPLPVAGCARQGSDCRPTAVDLADVLADVAPDLGGMPVLLRHYLGLGGRVVAPLNRDPDFADAVDALIVVDLLQSERKTLERYLGADATEAFLAKNAAGQPAANCA